jgi:hypothetical protein
VCEAAPSLALS